MSPLCPIEAITAIMHISIGVSKDPTRWPMYIQPSKPISFLGPRRMKNRMETARNERVRKTTLMMMISRPLLWGWSKLGTTPGGGGITGRFHKDAGIPPGPVGCGEAGVDIFAYPRYLVRTATPFAREPMHIYDDSLRFPRLAICKWELGVRRG